MQLSYLGQKFEPVTIKIESINELKLMLALIDPDNTTPLTGLDMVQRDNIIDFLAGAFNYQSQPFQGTVLTTLGASE